MMMMIRNPSCTYNLQCNFVKEDALAYSAVSVELLSRSSGTPSSNVQEMDVGILRERERAPDDGRRRRRELFFGRPRIVCLDLAGQGWGKIDSR